MLVSRWRCDHGNGDWHGRAGVGAREQLQPGGRDLAERVKRGCLNIQSR